jgi:hypothetical protein
VGGCGPKQVQRKIKNTEALSSVYILLMIQLIRCLTWSTALATSGASRYKDDQVRVVGLSLLEDHKIIAQTDSSI